MATPKKILVIGGYGESLLNFRGNLLKRLAENNHSIIACAPKASQQVKDFLKKISVEYHDVPLARASLNPLKDFCAFIALAQADRYLSRR